MIPIEFPLVREKSKARGSSSPAYRAEAPAPTVTIGSRLVGEGRPVYVIAEIGINHNGSIDVARQLVEGAKRAGCDAVKFQKRTPELCVPRSQWEVQRETPWGKMRYLDYKRRMEFGAVEYQQIADLCAKLELDWFASCWDIESVSFMERFSPPCYKAASASLTDHELLVAMKRTGKPLIISTGMSTELEIAQAVSAVGCERLLIAHSTSTYPCPIEELNLKMIHTLKRSYAQCPIGYSGHESGLAPTWAAVALGATFVERHITLDRAMWGTDHAASVDLSALDRLVGAIRDVERAVGDGTKRVYASELPIREKLRRLDTPSTELSPAGSALRGSPRDTKFSSPRAASGLEPCDH